MCSSVRAAHGGLVTCVATVTRKGLGAEDAACSAEDRCEFSRRSLGVGPIDGANHNRSGRTGGRDLAQRAGVEPADGKPGTVVGPPAALRSRVADELDSGCRPAGLRRRRVNGTHAHVISVRCSSVELFG